MGIQSKHAYRFGYLKSEKWQTLRIAALAENDASCILCKKRSMENDVHHFYYPPSFWDTKVDDVVILCRECHDFVHDLMALTANSKSDRDTCYVRFMAIVEACRKWLGRGVKVRVKSKKGIKGACCVCCTSMDDVEEREALPFNPRPGSIWKLCKECHDILQTRPYKEFKELREFMLDRKREKWD